MFDTVFERLSDRMQSSGTSLFALDRGEVAERR
jgi:hypothetical protein